MPPVFHIQTFGCQMNAGDSDWLARSLLIRGFSEGSFEDAGLYIVNTCSVRDKPEQKVYSELGRIARYNKVRGRTGITVCVGGCVAQQIGESLMRRFPEVRLLFGTDGIAHAPEAISRLMEEPRLRLSLLDFAKHYEERADVWSQAAGAGAPRREADDPERHGVPASAFVNIMQGCDNFCTYCIVPYVRGRQKSRAAEAVLKECRTLLAGGARELTLLGQNVNSYGRDAGGLGFAQLLRQVASLPWLERLRFVTSHPKDIAPEVIEAFAELDVLCPRLHLPVQSGSDRILRAMKRGYDSARYLDIVASLKKARPDILLTTDIIVGFPGETEEDFQETMRLMCEVGFASSFSFVYSDRPHAKASLLPGKVDRAVALDRLSRLQAWQNQTSEKLLEAMRNRETVILLEGKSRREALLEEGDSLPGEQDMTTESRAAQEDAPSRLFSWQGKTPHGFIVNVNLPFTSERSAGGWRGAMLPVHIDDVARHSLKGIQAGAPW